jgi:hypothetical protein
MPPRALGTNHVGNTGGRSQNERRSLFMAPSCLKNIFCNSSSQISRASVRRNRGANEYLELDIRPAPPLFPRLHSPFYIAFLRSITSNAPRMKCIDASSPDEFIRDACILYDSRHLFETSRTAIHHHAIVPRPPDSHLAKSTNDERRATSDERRPQQLRFHRRGERREGGWRWEGGEGEDARPHFILQGT